ncbi:hypothetical protein IB642_04125 [Allofrancisella guangzhouensis]|uniref:Uncharacterized protein n=1 Tax=Allofrancisella guangzhouensis TaxID=594679 RepID=A0A0A8E330_9GAMM|nr:hypothetical protein [Allofrancisella guangzhouensis]AJC48423.1 hypothetical protein SD28_01540 [Allofrancisella guangzhouensis]MBK2027022.1 hypothetical protein [Allofrancisella guangzhouensis]MBK2044206.1 hypothetical protein [Allofrancisella guangzhouensis]MBK2045144.1 hypothetical protein [Allofrancisella guangzhouensis]
MKKIILVLLVIIGLNVNAYANDVDSIISHFIISIDKTHNDLGYKINFLGENNEKLVAVLLINKNSEGKVQASKFANVSANSYFYMSQENIPKAKLNEYINNINEGKCIKDFDIIFMQKEYKNASGKDQLKDVTIQNHIKLPIEYSYKTKTGIVSCGAPAGKDIKCSFYDDGNNYNGVMSEEGYASGYSDSNDLNLMSE